MEEIFQKIVPSIGTKLVCTKCSREDWHVPILRRRKGLIEGLCKQTDGSGCYPNNSRRLCMFVDPTQIQCTQLSEWEIIDRSTNKTQYVVCTDHIGPMLTESGAYVSPLVD